MLYGNVETSAYERRTLACRWSGTQDILTNTTTISWELYTAGTYTGNRSINEIRLSVNGEAIYYRAQTPKPIVPKIDVVVASGTHVINHNNDGSKTITIKVEAGIYHYAINSTGEETFVLDTIPRASVLTCMSGTENARGTIYINRYVDTFKDNLYLHVGSTVTELAHQTSANQISFYYPNVISIADSDKMYADVTLQCDTYSGETFVASSFCVVRVLLDTQTHKPTTLATYTIQNGKNGKLLYNYSNVVAAVNCSADGAATLTGIDINGLAVPNNADSVFYRVTQNTFTLTATDSRGLKKAVTRTFEYYDYIVPTIAFNAWIDEETHYLSVYAKGMVYTGSFDNESNQFTVYLGYRLKGATTDYNWIGCDSTAANNTYEASKPIQIDYTKQYEVVCGIRDSITETWALPVIVSSIPAFMWNDTEFVHKTDVIEQFSVRNGETPNATEYRSLLFNRNDIGSSDVNGRVAQITAAVNANGSNELAVGVCNPAENQYGFNAALYAFHDGSSWGGTLFGNAFDSGWINADLNAAFENAWVLKYRKHLKTIEIRGAITPVSSWDSANETILFTLPAGFRSADNMVIYTAVDQQYHCTLAIYNNGRVSIKNVNNGSNWNSVISNGSYIFIQATFTAD